MAISFPINPINLKKKTNNGNQAQFIKSPDDGEDTYNAANYPDSPAVKLNPRPVQQPEQPDLRAADYSSGGSSPENNQMPAAAPPRLPVGDITATALGKTSEVVAPKKPSRWKTALLGVLEGLGTGGGLGGAIAGGIVGAAAPSIILHRRQARADAETQQNTENSLEIEKRRAEVDNLRDVPEQRRTANLHAQATEDRSIAAAKQSSAEFAWRQANKITDDQLRNREITNKEAAEKRQADTEAYREKKAEEDRVAKEENTVGQAAAAETTRTNTVAAARARLNDSADRIKQLQTGLQAIPQYLPDTKDEVSPDGKSLTGAQIPTLDAHGKPQYNKHTPNPDYTRTYAELQHLQSEQRKAQAALDALNSQKAYIPRVRKRQQISPEMEKRIRAAAISSTPPLDPDIAVQRYKAQQK